MTIELLLPVNVDAPETVKFGKVKPLCLNELEAEISQNCPVSSLCSVSFIMTLLAPDSVVPARRVKSETSMVPEGVMVEFVPSSEKVKVSVFASALYALPKSNEVPNSNAGQIPASCLIASLPVC